MKLFILFNSTIPLSIIGSKAEHIISKLSNHVTHTAHTGISSWLNFHKFVSLIPSGKNKFAMTNIYNELMKLSEDGSKYFVETSNTNENAECEAVAILLPSIVYNLGPKFLQDSEHNFTVKHLENGTSSLERTVGTRTVENGIYPTSDVKLAQLLQKYNLTPFL